MPTTAFSLDSSAAPKTIRCKRAYDSPAADDGYRVLVDGMWPRGISKQALKLDDWQKALAPSKELRQWFGHDPSLWAGFYQKFFHELEHSDEAREALSALLDACHGKTLTLVYAAKDESHNNAVALKQFIEHYTAQ